VADGVDGVDGDVNVAVVGENLSCNNMKLVADKHGETADNIKNTCVNSSVTRTVADTRINGYRALIRTFNLNAYCKSGLNRRL
jgi:hypothetical protein